MAIGRDLNIQQSEDKKIQSFLDDLISQQEHSVDVNTIIKWNGRKATIFHALIDFANKENMDVILEKIEKYFTEGLKPNLTLRESNQGMTALHFAVDRGKLPIVELLIKHDGPILMDSYKNKPLHTACLNHSLPLVKLLINACQPRHTKYLMIQATDRVGQRSLDVAATLGYPDIVAYLLKEDASYIDAGNGAGLTPLMCAASQCAIRNATSPESAEVIAGLLLGIRQDSTPPVLTPHEEVIKILLEQGADVNGGRNGENVLSYTTSIPHAMAFVARGANKNPGLRAAIRRNLLDMVDYLCTQGVDHSISYQSEDGRLTPFLYALKTGRDEIVPILLKHNKNAAKECFSDGCSALSYCMIHRKINIATSMIDACDDFSSLDNTPAPPLRTSFLEAPTFIKLLLDKNCSIKQNDKFILELMINDLMVSKLSSFESTTFQAKWEKIISAIKALQAAVEEHPNEKYTAFLTSAYEFIHSESFDQNMLDNKYKSQIRQLFPWTIDFVYTNGTTPLTLSINLSGNQRDFNSLAKRSKDLPLHLGQSLIVGNIACAELLIKRNVFSAKDMIDRFLTRQFSKDRACFDEICKNLHIVLRKFGLGKLADFLSEIDKLIDYFKENPHAPILLTYLESVKCKLDKSNENMAKEKTEHDGVVINLLTFKEEIKTKIAELTAEIEYCDKIINDLPNDAQLERILKDPKKSIFNKQQIPLTVIKKYKK